MERCLIERSVIEVEYEIRQMLDRYLWIRNKIKSINAYTYGETKERIELMEERKFLQRYLKMIGIQDFEIKNEWLVFNIE